VTAHTDAHALRQTLDQYLDTLALAGKEAPPQLQVKRSQFNAWLKTEGVAHYRGVQLVPVAERKRYKRTSTANWAQQLESQA
jgi:hypothetical protein